MKMTNEEMNLLKKLSSGSLDGIVGDNVITAGGSSVCREVKNGFPAMFKQEPVVKTFNGKEIERHEGALRTLQEWVTDEEKLQFLQKFGWLMKDADVKEYSAKFKPEK